MKHINESIIGKKGNRVIDINRRSNPCYKYVSDIENDARQGQHHHNPISRFFIYMGYRIHDDIFKAFFWNTDIYDDHSKCVDAMKILRNWAINRLSDYQTQAIHNGYKSIELIQDYANDHFREDAGDDDEFFEQCQDLGKYLKTKHDRFQLLCNFRIYTSWML